MLTVRLTEVGMSSLAVVCRGASLRLLTGGGRLSARGGRGGGVFAHPVGDGAGPDASEAQAAGRPRLGTVRLKGKTTT